MKKILVILITTAFFALPSFADEYEKMSPFAKWADSHAGTVQSTFESLPIVTDAEEIEKAGGTETIIKANINSRFSGGVSYGFSSRYENIQCLGNMDLSVRGPVKLPYEKQNYLWIAKGKVSFNDQRKNKEKRYQSFRFAQMYIVQ